MANPVPRLIGDNAETRRHLDSAARDVTSMQTDITALQAAEAILGTSSSAFAAGRVLTDTTSIDVDLGTAGQALFKRAALSGDVTAAADSNSVVINKASSAFSFTGIVTPAQITSNQDNYSPTGIAAATVLRLTSDASRTITGIDASSNTTGRILKIFNCNAVGSGFNLVFDGTSVASSAANRFVGLSVTVANGRFVELWYDITSAVWRFCL